jgi:hypothetical protein
MLVVPEQRPVRVRRQGGLAGAGEAEEHRNVVAVATLAEQCIGITPCCGRTKFRYVKTDFFISPA